MSHEARGWLRPSNDQVGTLLQAVLAGLFCQLAPGTLSAPLEAVPPPSAPPVSLERIREGLEKPPPIHLKLDVPMPLKPPTFKARVDQRVFVLTLEEALHKEFDLNDLQRQSAEWSSKCCGYNLGALMKKVDEALQERKIRKTREQIARELAELEAARKKSE
jgi:hypothetical protein